MHAALLYDALNNTVTPAGHRVIAYLDVRRLVKGEDWEQVASVTISFIHRGTTMGK